MNRRKAVAALLAGGIAAGLAASPKLQYCAYNLADGMVQSQHTLSAEEQRKKALMQTGNKDLDQMVEAYVEYVEANDKFNNASGISRKYWSFVSSARYGKFAEIDTNLGFNISKSMSTDEQIRFWNDLGFVYSAELAKNQEGNFCNSITFGRITKKKDNLVYKNGKDIVKYSAISFDPIIKPNFKLGFWSDGKAYLDNAQLKVQARDFRRYVQDVILRKKVNTMNFDEKMCYEAYTLLSDMAVRSGKSIEAVTMDTYERSVLSVHEPQHELTPDSEEPSFWRQVSMSKDMAEQSLVLSRFKSTFTSEYLDEKTKAEILKADFNGREKIANRIFLNLKAQKDH